MPDTPRPDGTPPDPAADTDGGPPGADDRDPEDLHLAHVVTATVAHLDERLRAEFANLPELPPRLEVLAQRGAHVLLAALVLNWNEQAHRNAIPLSEIRDAAGRTVADVFDAGKDG